MALAYFGEGTPCQSFRVDAALPPQRLLQERAGGISDFGRHRLSARVRLLRLPPGACAVGG